MGIKELSEKSASSAELIKTLTINFLEEKMGKSSGAQVDSSRNAESVKTEYEAKIQLLKQKIEEGKSDSRSSQKYETRISVLEKRCSEAEEKSSNSTKTLIQQTNNIRKNYEEKIIELESKFKEKKGNIPVFEEKERKLKDQLNISEEKIIELESKFKEEEGNISVFEGKEGKLKEQLKISENKKFDKIKSLETSENIKKLKEKMKKSEASKPNLRASARIRSKRLSI